MPGQSNTKHVGQTIAFTTKPYLQFLLQETHQSCADSRLHQLNICCAVRVGRIGVTISGVDWGFISRNGADYLFMCGIRIVVTNAGGAGDAMTLRRG